MGGSFAAISFVLKNRLAELETLRACLEQFAETHELPPRAAFETNLALDELVTNIISYSYDDELEHEIRIDMALADGVLTLRVQDDGQPFNPLEAAPPDLDSPAEDRPIGGLGIHLVRKVMDEVRYQRDGGANVLTLTKNVCAKR